MRATRWLVVLTVLCLVGTRAYGDVSLEEAFSKTAAMEGFAYKVCRDYLLRQGQAIVPLLTEKAKSPKWQERDLARALLLRIAEPGLADVCQQFQRSGEHRWQVDKDGAMVIRFDPALAEWAKNYNKPAPPAEARITKAMTPLLLEQFREEIRRGSNYHYGSRLALDMLDHLADADSVPALLHWREQMYEFEEDKLAKILGKVGAVALPHLRVVVQEEGRYAPQLAARYVARFGTDKDAVVLFELFQKRKEESLRHALAKAVGQMKHLPALPAIYTALVEAAETARKGPRYYRTVDAYNHLREAVIAYGNTALPYLRDKQARKELAARAITKGLLWTLENPDAAAKFQQQQIERPELFAAMNRTQRGHVEYTAFDPNTQEMQRRLLQWPAPLLIEYGYVFADSKCLVPMSKVKNEPLVFDVLADALNLSLEDRDAVHLALAQLGDERALDVFSKHLDLARDFDAYASYPEAALLLGSPKGVAFLENFVRFLEQNKSGRGLVNLAQSVIPVLQGKEEALAALLEAHETQGIAVRHLARRQDLRAVPLLIAEMARPQDTDEPWRGRYARFRLDAVELRAHVLRYENKAVPILERIEKETTDPITRLLCESLKLRITNPALGGKFQLAAEESNNHVTMPMRPRYLQGGQVLAEQIGKEGIPLMEAALLFHMDVFPQCAAYALAILGAERSIEPVVRAIPYLDGLREENLAADVLTRFGPKGIEAAKKVPPPDPNKARFNDRAMRHLGATATLAESEDPKGFDNIIDFLKQPPPKTGTPEFDAWKRRADAYLELSKSYHDPRLVPLLLGLPENSPVELRILTAVMRYPEAKVAPRAVQQLGKEAYQQGDVIDVLFHQLGVGAADAIVKHLRETRDDKERAVIAAAIGSLARHDHVYWQPAVLATQLRKETDEIKKQALEKEKQKLNELRRSMIERLRNLSFEPLLQGVQDASPLVQQACAEGLVQVAAQMSKEDRLRTMPPLVGWLRRAQVLHENVTHYLCQLQDPAITEVFLELYGTGRGWSSSYAGHYFQACKEAGLPDKLLTLFRKLDHKDDTLPPTLALVAGEKALDDLVQAAKKHNVHGVYCLVILKEPGIDALERLYREAKTGADRWFFARTLYQHRILPGMFEALAPTLAEWAADEKEINHLHSDITILAAVDRTRTHSLLYDLVFRATPRQQESLAEAIWGVESDHPKLKGRKKG